MENSKIRRIIVKLFAWIGLLLIVTFLILMIHGMIHHNGNLILAMITSIILVSILYWIGIRFLKKHEKELKDKNV